MELAGSTDEYVHGSGKQLGRIVIRSAGNEPVRVHVVADRDVVTLEGHQVSLVSGVPAHRDFARKGSLGYVILTGSGVERERLGVGYEAFAEWPEHPAPVVALEVVVGPVFKRVIPFGKGGFTFKAAFAVDLQIEETGVGPVAPRPLVRRILVHENVVREDLRLPVAIDVHLPVADGPRSLLLTIRRGDVRMGHDHELCLADLAIVEIVDSVQRETEGVGRLIETSHVVSEVT